MITRKVPSKALLLLHDGQDFVVVSQREREWLFTHVIEGSAYRTLTPEDIRQTQHAKLYDSLGNTLIWLGYLAVNGTVNVRDFYRLDAGKIVRVTKHPKLELRDHRIHQHNAARLAVCGNQNKKFRKILQDALCGLGFPHTAQLLKQMRSNEIAVLDPSQNMRKILHVDAGVGQIKQVFVAPDGMTVAALGHKNNVSVFDVE